MSLPSKIVVIHDDLIPKSDPLLVELYEIFGEQNVIHFVHSNEGLDYILKNLSQKMIVILDVNFSSDELNGVQVLEKIRSETSLVYVIMITARTLRELDNDYLISMVNNDALAIENSDDYPKIVSLAKAAAHKLDVRVDSVLEDWITKLPKEKRAKPYITTKEGKTYTLDDILSSIRSQTELGKHMERNILKLAVDLLTRQKTKLDD